MTDVGTEGDLQACYLDPTDDYDLTADITITSNFWAYMIDGYTGTFDGHNYTIYDFTITPTGHYGGLFKQNNSAGNIQNINMEDTSITVTADYRYIASLCGFNYLGDISGCNIINASMSSIRYYMAIMIAYERGGTVSNCTTSGTLTKTGNYHTCGGIIGCLATNPATITNCSNSATLNSQSSQTGGIIAFSNNMSATLTGCYNTGTITAGQNCGGLVGSSGSGTISYTNCYNTGTVTGYRQVGGLHGYGRCNMDNCYDIIQNIQTYSFRCSYRHENALESNTARYPHTDTLCHCLNVRQMKNQNCSNMHMIALPFFNVHLITASMQ
jgi:hypothetical protein